MITAAAIVTGRVTVIGAKPQTVAIASAPKATCDSPSPIIEYLFSTRLTPSRAAQSEISTPAISA